MDTISFIRHGHVHNPDNIFYGRLPNYRLSSTGLAEAKKAAEALRDSPLAALFHSPLLRTRQTASQILKYHPSLKSSSSNDLLEVNTPFDGLSESEQHRFHMDAYHDKDTRWEQPADIIHRLKNFIHRVRRQYQGKHVAAVTHGDIILFAMFWALSVDITPENKLNLHTIESIKEYPATASITTLTFFSGNQDEIPALHYSNVSSE